MSHDPLVPNTERWVECRDDLKFLLLGRDARFDKNASNSLRTDSAKHPVLNREIAGAALAGGARESWTDDDTWELLIATLASAPTDPPVQGSEDEKRLYAARVLMNMVAAPNEDEVLPGARDDVTLASMRREPGVAKGAVFAESITIRKAYITRLLGVTTVGALDWDKPRSDWIADAVLTAMLQRLADGPDVPKALDVVDGNDLALEGESEQPSSDERPLRRRWPWFALAAGAVVAVVVAALVIINVPRVTSLPLDGPSTVSPELKSVLEGEVAPPDRSIVTMDAATWGPQDRAEIAEAARTSTVALNSLFDDPEYGDERQFVRVKPAEAPDGAYTDRLVVTPGQNYVASVYVHNDAREGSTAATGVRVRLQMSGVMYGATNAYAFVGADNAAVPEVWSGFTLLLDAPDEVAALRYVSKSAAFHTLGGGAFPLADSAFTDGVPLGCDALDGVIPANDSCAGYVTFEFRVDQPNFEVAATARVAGTEAALGNRVIASSGDVLELLLEYRNTGSTRQEDVVLQLGDLAEGMHYVPESTRVYNSVSGDSGVGVGDDIVTGLDIGNYAPNATAYITLRVQIDRTRDGVAGLRWIELSPAVVVMTRSGDKSADLTVTLLE